MKNELKYSDKILTGLSLFASLAQIIMLFNALMILFPNLYKMAHFGWPIIEYIYHFLFYLCIIFFIVYYFILIFSTIIGFMVFIRKIICNDYKIIFVINLLMLIPTIFISFSQFSLL